RKAARQHDRGRQSRRGRPDRRVRRPPRRRRPVRGGAGDPRGASGQTRPVGRSMPDELLLPLIIFLILLGTFAVVLRRVGVVIGESREHAVFRESVQDLAGWIDETLGGIIG